MKSYWKLFLGLLLIFAAVLVCTCGYMPAREEYMQERARLEESLSSLRNAAIENSCYLEAREQIYAEHRAVAEVRSEIYEQLPEKMKEEDQLLYVAELEEAFGGEISFDFGEKEELAVLADGSALTGLNLTLKFRGNFGDIRYMMKLLEQQKLVTVSSAELNYDSFADESRGSVTIMHYMIDDIAADK